VCPVCLLVCGIETDWQLRLWLHLFRGYRYGVAQWMKQHETWATVCGTVRLSNWVWSMCLWHFQGHTIQHLTRHHRHMWQVLPAVRDTRNITSTVQHNINSRCGFLRATRFIIYLFINYRCNIFHRSCACFLVCNI